MEKQGKQSGTKQMIELLKLGQRHGRPRLQEAVEQALVIDENKNTRLTTTKIPAAK